MSERYFTVPQLEEHARAQGIPIKASTIRRLIRTGHLAGFLMPGSHAYHVSESAWDGYLEEAERSGIQR